MTGEAPTITLCAIVRNEEIALPGMIESAKGCVDEIVILDTGSTDSTVEIARQYTERVGFRPWDGSFAEARNYAQQHCASDWILMLDADERLSESAQASIKQICSNVPDSVDLILMPMQMCRDDGRVYQQFLAERLYRNGKGYKWHADMHNWIDVPTTAEKRCVGPSLTIVHNRATRDSNGRDARAKQRLEMSEATFLPAIEADPRDRRSIFYLAGTYLDSEMPEKAIPWFERYFQVSEWSHERYQAALLAAEAYVQVGRREDARKVLSAHLIDNYARAEALVRLGKMAQEDGDHEQAARWFQYASLCPVPLDPLFVEVDCHTWEPHQGLFVSYAAIGDNVRAFEHGKIAAQLGSPSTNAIVKFGKNHSEFKAEKIAVLADRGQTNFIEPVMRHWHAAGKEVCIGSTVEDIDDILAWGPDIIWCEWAGKLLIELSKRPKQCRIIVRVHGYEVHNGYIGQIDWRPIDDVIFVANYLETLAVGQAPQMAELCNLHVVPGGVETDKFTIGEHKTGNKIAMAAYGNQKKNFPMALQILAKCPGYELHIATEWQDHRLKMYCEHLVGELGLSDRVFWHPWQDDLNAFHADKDIYLSTSQEESFCYSLAEAMAAGLAPVIHNWISARDFYPDNCLFNTVDEAVRLIKGGKVAPICWREYAAGMLDIAHNLKRIDRIINRPSVAIAGEAKYPDAAENKLADCLERLGFRTDAPNPELVILAGRNPAIEPWMDGAKTVFWTAEYMLGDEEFAVERRESVRDTVANVDYVCYYHADHADLIAEMGAKKAVHIPWMGAHPPFRKLDVKKIYDIGFYGWPTEHRQAKLKELARNLDIVVYNDTDHRKLNIFINRCKIIVNLHSTPHPLVETRIAECMAAGACVVSEKLPEGHPYPEDCFFETDNLEATITTVLGDNSLREEAARNAYRWIWSKYTLERQVEKVVEIAGL